MLLSSVGLQFVAKEETFVAHRYLDFAGVLTIGYGHVVRAGETFTEVSHERALELLASDVAATEGHVNRLVTVPVGQHQFDALVSLVFNIGPGPRGFEKSTTLRLLNEGDQDGAADAFLLWDKYTDKKTGKLLVSDTLRGRRARERAMFLMDAATRPPRDYTANVQPGAGVIRRDRIAHH
jgi:lysozyme